MTLYNPSAAPPPPQPAWEDHPVTRATHHVVVPAAVIAMAASLLFYLADVRSAFLGGGPALKWIGLCFATAVVLIERYRRSSGAGELQGCYTFALAGATALVLLSEPWETQPTGWSGKLANLLIVAVVGLFATGITRGLSPEAGPETKVSPNPAAGVARLAAIALLAFALGEPTLLQAAPQTGERALAAVIVFLLATGVTLAAGSSMGTLRRIESAGGSVAPALVPARALVAALLMVAVLAAGLAVPGIQVRGTGRLRPPPAPGVGADADRGYREGQKVRDPRAGRRGLPGGENSRAPVVSPDSLEDPSSQHRNQVLRRELGPRVPTPSGSFLNALAALGKWLLVPLALALVAAGLHGLSRLAPRLGRWRRKAAERWRALFAGLFRRSPRRASDPGPDPLENLGRFAQLPAREAVLAAYHAFLSTCSRLGHPRPERATPYEFLQALPPGLRSLQGPAGTLTDLYVNAAYGPDPVSPEDRETALGALAKVKAGLSTR